MDPYYGTLKGIIKAYQMLFPQDCRVFGSEHIPDGAKVIAANHPNMTDTFHLLFVIQGRIHTLILGEMYGNRLIGGLLSKAGQILVPSNKKQVALLQACESLAKGETVLIYPEAQMNPENKRLKGKTGAVRMALISGAPILPLGIYVPEYCTHTISRRINGLVRRGRWQTCGRCYLYFGEPWLPANESYGKISKALVTDLTEQLMEKIYNLSFQAYQACLEDQGTHLIPKPTVPSEQLLA